jgi:hypothetical protein
VALVCFLNLAHLARCAAAILALSLIDIVRLGVATLASPLTLAHRALWAAAILLLPAALIILLTAHEAPEVHKASQKVGIHALVPKSKASTHLIAQAESLVYPTSRAAS